MPTTTTTTTTTTRRLIKVPKPKAPRLVKRTRKIVIRTRTASIKGAKVSARQTAKAAPAIRNAEVLSITTTPSRTRALPAPKPVVSELTVKERQRLPAPRR